MTFTPDLVHEGHLTLYVTFPISGPSEARAMKFFFVSRVFWVKELKKHKINTVTFTPDLVREGHLTLYVTFPISGPSEARAMNFFSFWGVWL